MKKFSLPYIAKQDSKILILGTMPGERSLVLKEYYGHRGNHFWKIMFHLFGEPYSNEYQVKVDLLLNNKIALWDVLEYCQRVGSADNAIKDEYPNNFPHFFKEHSQLTTIIFNGKKAKELYVKYIGINPPYGFHVCPSTSPANTWFTYEEKSKQWQIVKDIL